MSLEEGIFNLCCWWFVIAVFIFFCLFDSWDVDQWVNAKMIVLKNEIRMSRFRIIGINKGIGIYDTRKQNILFRLNFPFLGRIIKK